MFESILVALDGSKLAEQALPYTVEIANAFASEVFLIKVCRTEEIDFSSVSQAYLNKQAEQLRKKLIGEIRINISVSLGRPAQEIIRYAVEKNISLIIITSTGRSGIIPWLLGSTANEIIHSVKVPLLVVKVSKSPPSSVKLKRLLVPLDGSERSEAILPYTTRLAQKLSAEVILIQIVAPGRHVHTIGGLDYVYFKDKDMESMKTAAQEYLDRIVARLAREHVTIKREIRIGEPSSEIASYADENHCDLITMSSHGHSYVERWTYGSVAYKILHSSNRPVLILPLKTTDT